MQPRPISSPSEQLPSGVAPTELGLEREGPLLRLPLGLIAPEEVEAQVLVRAAGASEQPAWWRNPAERHDVTVVVSVGAISLNSQLMPILEAADAAGATSLAIIAPTASDEALATLLINDLHGAFPGGILPLGVHAEEFHKDEVIEWIAAQLGVTAWDGRPQNLQFARVGSLRATHEGVAIQIETELAKAPSLLARASRWLGRR